MLRKELSLVVSLVCWKNSSEVVRTGVLDNHERRLESTVQEKMTPVVREMEKLGKQLGELNDNVEKLIRVLEKNR